MGKKVYVQIAGGLGNQLFQIAAALDYCDQDDEVNLLTGLAYARQTNGKADILNLQLPNKVSFQENVSNNRVYRKMASLGTRLSSSEARKFIHRLTKSLYLVLAKIVFSVYLGKLINVRLANGIGFTEIRPSKRDVLLLGYFQSYSFSRDEKIFHKIKGLFDDLAWRKEVLQVIGISKPRLLLHFRLTDYLNHPQFGVLDPSFYLKAILEIKKRMRFDEVWLISDDDELAGIRYNSVVQSFPPEIDVIWINTQNFTSWETLQIFRNAQAYILANSSFGWWGARLCHSQSPLVIVPQPWFADLEAPKKMHPENWIELLR